jgi:quercetin dioxygenase-like cupin family protein
MVASGRRLANKPLKLTAAGFCCASDMLKAHRGSITRGRSLAAVRWAARSDANVAGRIRELKRVFSTDEVQVSYLVLAPEEEVPWHFHSNVCDTFYVLRGPVTISTREPDGTAVISTGETFQTRERQPHRVHNTSDHEVSFVLIQGVGKFDFHPLATLS